MPTVLRNREFYNSLLAIAVGGGALFLLRALPWGTLERIGPAALPGLVAIALLAAGAWHMLRTVLMPSPRRQARTGYSWLDLLPWTLLVALMLLATTSPPWLASQLMKMGPPDYVGLWLLVLALVFATSWLAERGSLSRLAIPILLGTLCALGGIDVSSGVVRFWDDDPNFMHGVLAGALVVALRLPVVSFVIPCTLGVQIEEQIRRSMLLSRGDLDIFIRPISAVLLCLAALIVVAVLVGRFSGRRRR